MKPSLHSCTSLLAAAAISFAVQAHSSNAATLVDDTFFDAGRTNGADALDVSWVTIGTAGGSATIVSDETTGPDEGPADSALRLAGSTFGGVLGTFSTTTLAIGETMTLSFDMDFEGTPGTNTAGFRFGLYNSNATAAGDDSGSGNDFGYRWSVSTNGSSASGLLRETGGFGNTLTGDDFGSLDSGASFLSANIGATTNRFEVSIIRGATSNSFAFTLNGVDQVITAGADSNYYTFNEIVIGRGNISSALRIDNVLLTVVPEPSTVGFLAVGLGSLCLRRRSRGTGQV